MANESHEDIKANAEDNSGSAWSRVGWPKGKGTEHEESHLVGRTGPAKVAKVPDELRGARPLIHVAFATSGETKRSPCDGGVAKALRSSKEKVSRSLKAWEVPECDNSREVIAEESVVSIGSEFTETGERSRATNFIASSIAENDAESRAFIFLFDMDTTN